MFALAECKLAIVHCAGHYDPILIETLWKDIIEGGMLNNESNRQLLTKFACSKFMGLHSSIGKSTAAPAQRPWVRIPLKSRNFLSGYFVESTTATIISSHRFVFPQFTSSFRVSFLYGLRLTQQIGVLPIYGSSEVNC